MLETARNQGNFFYKSHNYSTALSCYKEGIRCLMKMRLILSNINIHSQKNNDLKHKLHSLFLRSIDDEIALLAMNCSTVCLKMYRADKALSFCEYALLKIQLNENEKNVDDSTFKTRPTDREKYKNMILNKLCTIYLQLGNLKLFNRNYRKITSISQGLSCFLRNTQHRGMLSYGKCSYDESPSDMKDFPEQSNDPIAQNNIFRLKSNNSTEDDKDLFNLPDKAKLKEYLQKYLEIKNKEKKIRNYQKKYRAIRKKEIEQKNLEEKKNADPKENSINDKTTDNSEKNNKGKNIDFTEINEIEINTDIEDDSEKNQDSDSKIPNRFFIEQHNFTYSLLSVNFIFKTISLFYKMNINKFNIEWMERRNVEIKVDESYFHKEETKELDSDNKNAQIDEDSDKNTIQKLKPQIRNEQKANNESDRLEKQQPEDEIKVENEELEQSQPKKEIKSEQKNQSIKESQSEKKNILDCESEQKAIENVTDQELQSDTEDNGEEIKTQIENILKENPFSSKKYAHLSAFPESLKNSVSENLFVLGDTHGNLLNTFLKVQEITNNFSESFKGKIVFNGDFVDRGKMGLELVMFLYLLKIYYDGATRDEKKSTDFDRNNQEVLRADSCFTNHILFNTPIDFNNDIFSETSPKIALNRGNHELRDVNERYTFLSEIIDKYRFHSTPLHKFMNDSFQALSICAISNGIFIVHGGLTDDMGLEEIEDIDRKVNKLRHIGIDWKSRCNSQENESTEPILKGLDKKEDTGVNLEKSSDDIHNVQKNLEKINLLSETDKKESTRETAVEQSKNSTEEIVEKPKDLENRETIEKLNDKLNDLENKEAVEKSKMLNEESKDSENKGRVEKSEMLNEESKGPVEKSKMSNDKSQDLENKPKDSENKGKESTIKEKKIETAKNKVETFTVSSMLTGMLWSDPRDIPVSERSRRGAGIHFSYSSITNFFKRSGLFFIIRSHEYNKECFQKHHDERTVTVFSAVDYDGEINDGKLMEIRGMFYVLHTIT